MFKPRSPFKPKPVGEERGYDMPGYGMRHDHGQFLNSMPTCDYRDSGTYMDVKLPTKGGKRGP